MSEELIALSIRAAMPTSSGWAVFLDAHNKEDPKVFVIYVDVSIGEALSLAINRTPKERPLTHDLIVSIFQGAGILLEQVVINDTEAGTFFARLILKMENELGTKLIEIDARPSDCMILATHLKRPIYTTSAVLDSVEDMSEVLERLLKEG